MLSTYHAVLRGHVLEWSDEKPQDLGMDRAVQVYVTILEEVKPEAISEQGRRMAAALEQLAQLEAGISTVDAMTWQQEIRQDRTLSGRDTDAD
jgi:hypothetical protein